MDWSSYFLNIAKTVSEKSKDKSTKVGAVIADSNNNIVSVGFNGFPRGVLDLEERYDNRELKYKLIVHSEINALCSAARRGIALDNCTIYLTHPPCSQCAKALIQAGIRKIVTTKVPEDFQKRWEEDFKLRDLMFKEAQVEMEVV